MKADSPRWNEITPSEFPWEQEALAYVRNQLPDQEPIRAWSNFEFVADDGSINEVDLLVVSEKGIFLIEIKSRPGVIEGDMGTWRWSNDGRVFLMDNPLLLANKKAKRLKYILSRQKAMKGFRPPYIKAIVFLSAPGLKCRLDQTARAGIYLRDDASGGKETGVITVLTAPTFGLDGHTRVDAALSKAVGRALDDAGIRRSHKYRKVGDYELELSIFEGPGYQDWIGKHSSIKDYRRRVRIYGVGSQAGMASRETVLRAAQREFQLLRSIQHEAILRAEDYRDSELGPALLFEFDEKAIRLDYFLRDQNETMTVDRKLGFLRQVAEALSYAHGKRLFHRALSPQSVLVRNPDSAMPKLQIYNWQTGGRGAGTASQVGITATRHLGALIEEGATPYMAPEALQADLEAAVSLDVFSLGALAYHLFSGKPPGSSFEETTSRVREGRGLRLDAEINGVTESLCRLVRFATHPNVTDRLDSVADFIGYLDMVEEDLTKPEEDAVDDPVEAKAGDQLGGGIVVEKRLGRGATSVAFVVSRNGERFLLKLALNSEQNERLRDEAAVLEKLRDASVVKVHETLEIKGLTGILMARAGEETLAKRIRDEGRLNIDLLERFDNAHEMDEAWRDVFKAVDKSTLAEVSGGETDRQGAGPWSWEIPFDITLSTPLAAANFSRRALNALEKENVLDVRALLLLPLSRISHMRSVGNKTRRELLTAITQLREKFPETFEPALETPERMTEDEDGAAYSIDLIAMRLIRPRIRNVAHRESLSWFLGLDPMPGKTDSPWPGQTEVAEAAKLTRARIGQFIMAARKEWMAHPSLKNLRDEIEEILESNGGVMSHEELEAAVLSRRGSSASEPLRSRQARAVTRAAIEAEFAEELPRWVMRRKGERILLSLDHEDGEALADLGFLLGVAADKLAEEDPLPAPASVMEKLASIIARAEISSITPQRMIYLAAKASANAAASPRLELYPRNLPAARALKLSLGALLGSQQLTVDQIRDRVRARYPESEPLPGPLELDRLLRENGLEMSWDPTAASGAGAYKLPSVHSSTLSSGSTSLTRFETRLAPGPFAELSPEITEAGMLEEKLLRSAREGGFLALAVDPRYMERVAGEMAKRLPIEVRSLDVLLISAMRKETTRLGADWSVVLAADASETDSEDWRNLVSVVRSALPNVERKLESIGKTVLLTYPGLLTRYGLLSFLEKLRDRAGARPDGNGIAIHGIWVLIPQDEQRELPVLDGSEIPVTGRNQWARIPEAWIRNVHRAEAVAG